MHHDRRSSFRRGSKTDSRLKGSWSKLKPTQAITVGM
ncbi:unnamed protein product, partial [Rotaria magnacalcarata]